MKLVRFIHNENQDSVQDAIDTVTMHVLAYAKTYELLHKQIWRKAPYRISIATMPEISTFNDRPVGFIRKWDIKTPARIPYSYGGGDHSFGLNQLFIGQDYRKEYEGDPKDGIYHDDCYIIPRSIETDSTHGHMTAWIYYSNIQDSEVLGGVSKNYNSNLIWYKERYDGAILIDNVSMQYYIKDTLSYRRIVINNHDSTTSYIELGVYDPNTFLGDGIELGACDSIKSVFGYKNWYNTNNTFSGHGEIIEQYKTDTVNFSDSTLTWLPEQKGWIRLYQDGTVVQFEPEYENSYYGDTYYPPSYSILPMVYLDTGDLVMNKVDFVENWSTYFELVVHEDSEWWTDLIKPIAIIIVAIITYFTWGATSGLLAAAVAIGGTLSIIGIISDNKNLMIIGGIMMLGASLYAAIDAVVANAASSTTLSTMGANQALVGTSFESTFAGYTSAAGMENLLVMPTVESYTSLALDGVITTSTPYAGIGVQTAGMNVADYVSLGSSSVFDSVMSISNDIYGLYNNFSSLSVNSSTSPSVSSEPKQKKVLYTPLDERLFDPNKVIDNVINIL